MKKTVLLCTLAACSAGFAKESFKLTTLTSYSRQVGKKTYTKTKELSRPLEIEKKGNDLIYTSKPNDKRGTIIDRAKTVKATMSAEESLAMVKAIEDLLVSKTYNEQIKSDKENVFFKSKKGDIFVYYLPKDKEKDRKKYQFWVQFGQRSYLTEKRDLSKIASAVKREASRKGK